MIQNPQESSNLFATITTKLDGQDIPAINVSTALNSNLGSFTVSVGILNQDVCKTNAADVQQQLNDYIANTIKTKMAELNYPIVLT